MNIIFELLWFCVPVFWRYIVKNGDYICTDLLVDKLVIVVVHESVFETEWTDYYY